jgi:hypothetical protein
MEPFGSRQDVGIDGKTNLVKSGSFPKIALHLIVTYFNWIWRHSCLETTAAQRAELTLRPWTWNDIAAYPTLS